MDESDLTRLKDITILRLLPPDTQAKILQKFKKETFSFGQVIVKEGDQANVFYLLVSGRVRVITTAPDGSEIPINSLAAGDCFGEMGLLTSGIRTKTVRASCKVTALVLSGDDFNAIISENSAVREHIHLLVKYRNIQNFLREFSSIGKIMLIVATEFPVVCRGGEILPFK